MGNWMSIVRGTGQHHNGPGMPADADVMHAQFVGKLKANGQNVTEATFLHGDAAQPRAEIPTADQLSVALRALHASGGDQAIDDLMRRTFGERDTNEAPARADMSRRPVAFSTGVTVGEELSMSSPEVVAPPETAPAAPATDGTDAVNDTPPGNG